MTDSTEERLATSVAEQVMTAPDACVRRLCLAFITHGLRSADDAQGFLRECSEALDGGCLHTAFPLSWAALKGRVG